MNKTTLLVLCLLFVALAHKDKPQAVTPEHNLRPEQKPDSIYKPFTDFPKPQEGEVINIKVAEKNKPDHDHEELSPEKQKEYEEFNQMLSYGLVFGTILLAILLVKTCAIKGKRQTVRMAPATQRYTQTPQQPKISSVQIKVRIQMHKNEIKKLEQMAKHAEEVERQVMEERQKEMRREQETLKAYYNQYQMQQRIEPRNHFNVYNAHPSYQYYENVPIGRPLPKDNDSSFASEYPTL